MAGFYVVSFSFHGRPRRMLAVVSEGSTGTLAWFWPLKVNAARRHVTDDLSAGAVTTLHAGTWMGSGESMVLP